MFKKLDGKLNLNQLEIEVLEFWQSNKIFAKSLENRQQSPVYFFYDGPPFATGTPHYGHILAGTIKDVIPRYRTMCGYYVERRFGWDCHGLPVEFEAEKELNLKGKLDIEKYGIANYNEYCRSIVLRYSNQWRSMVTRMGRWIDLDNDYKTMDKDFMESIWWIFDKLFKEGLIYLSQKVVAYSPRLTTPLSNFEVNLGYRTIKDPSITVKFKALNKENTYFLAWTTTPWTLPSSLSLTVHPDIEYCLVECGDENYYIAKEAIDKTFGDKKYVIKESLLGKQLENIKYEPLFPYFKNLAAFYVTLGDYVATQKGTGIIQTAPSFGEDDFRTAQRYSLPLVMPFNDSCEFNEQVPDYKGLFFKDADPIIIKDLKARKMLFKNEQIEHEYPFCWRTDAPLMYRTVDSWFVKVEKIKEQLLTNNHMINWQPNHIKEGRMGHWLENARDWAISRNRYWGSTIPVWICEKCHQKQSFGSIADLEKASGQKINDLHRHFVDEITLNCPSCNSIMRRTPEVLDCWFESGAMPYAQQHYPFENKQKFDRSFPADFISEGLDQTRGWFYTLLVLSTALFGKPAFKNCIVSGLILADDGQKMSKRRQNYPDPKLVIKEFGADTVRLYMLNSGAIKAEELKFSKQGLQETIRGHILPIWNVLNFFTTYANLDQWTPPAKEELSLDKDFNSLDLWMLSRLANLSQKVSANLNNYNLNGAIQPLLMFNDQLTNWYLRRSRRRFWKSDKTIDKDKAYQTTYYVLINIAKLLAPIIPFLSETIYQILKLPNSPSSVHLCDYPQISADFIDKKLEDMMSVAISTSQLGRSLRTANGLKLRQPLNKVTILSKHKDVQQQLSLAKEFIKEELNVKHVVISDKEEEQVNFVARPNLPMIGKKYGPKIPLLKKALQQVSSSQLVSVIAEKKLLNLTIDKESIQLSSDELIIDRVQKEDQISKSDDKITVVLDTKIDHNLLLEGISREVINRLQNARKTLDLDVNSKIEVKIGADQITKEAIKNHQQLIMNECLCKNLYLAEDNFIGQHQTTIGESCLTFDIKST